MSELICSTRMLIPVLLDRSSVLPKSEETWLVVIVPALMLLPSMVAAAILSPVIVPARISFAVIVAAAIWSAVTDRATSTEPFSFCLYFSSVSCAEVSPPDCALIS